MKIAFITLGFAPVRTSGLDLSGERLVGALLGAGHQVTVIAGSHGPTQETVQHPSLTIRRLPLGRTDWVGFAWRAARLLSGLGPFDVVHFWDVHFAWAYRGRYVASPQHSFRQRLLSLGRFSPHPFWLYRFTYYSLARRAAEIPATRRALGLLAGSATTRDEFIQHYDVDPGRIVLARHGIDTGFFRPDPRAGEIRRSLGLEDGEPVILFAGFITPRKGLEYLAQALPLIQPAPKLLLLGRWRSESYRQKVLQSLGSCKDRVIETGFVPDEQMPAYLTLSDVYVTPSLLEGFGLPLAESLACETPVVTTGAGAAAEVLGPGGLIVPQRDPAALAEAISTLLQDPSRRRAMGAMGREHIQKEFSLERMLRDTLEGYVRFSKQGLV